MQIPFIKYQGAGNDFVIIDNRQKKFNLTENQIELICDRHFGIGADGLMFLQSHPEMDFEMIYYNSDGKPSSMCGNGGRCIVSFAGRLGLFSQSTNFVAVDGVHRAKLISEGVISLEMIDVDSIEIIGDNDYLLDTGSPHYIRFVKDVSTIDLINEAHSIRYSDRFNAAGVNVNFVSNDERGFQIRTYERGVENETLACGTGVTAAAIAAHKKGIAGKSVIISAQGGELKVTFDVSTIGYSNIWKTGPAHLVFTGNIEV